METQCQHTQRPQGDCGTVPPLERLCYFFGQMLEPADFRAEQAYFSTRLSLLTRHAIGWGVACGLDIDVSVAPADRCDDQPEVERLMVTVSAGVAFDCCGRVIVVREPYCFRLWSHLDEAGRAGLTRGEPLYLSIEHVERPVRPTRGVGDAGCDPLVSPQYGRLRDEARVRVRLERPDEATCEQCLTPCRDSAILLAVLRWQTTEAGSHILVQPEARRMLGRHQLATISAIGWMHGGTYARRTAESALAYGVGVRFSRPVRAATLRPGVVDLVVYEGGSGRRDAWYVKGVQLEVAGNAELVDQVRIKLVQPEGFQEGDRILLAIRADFVLDECCRAMSGAHRAGGVPFDPALSTPDIEHPPPLTLACPHPPERRGPWESGNSFEGGTFETWIYVGADEPYGRTSESPA